MSTPAENSALTAELQRLAADLVDTAKQTFGIDFDFSEQSLQQLDGAISQFHSDGNVPDSTLLGCGSYVGETIRRNLGGVWVQDERGVALLQSVGGVGVSANPFSWAQKRFVSGMAHSLANKYSDVRGEVAQARATAPGPAIPATPQAAFGLKIAGGQPPNGTADSETLARAPILVFLLVAAADGKVDKKELAAFEKVLGSAIACPSPRLREAIAEMLPKIAEHLEQILSDSVDPLAELKRVAEIVDTHYPAEAEAFKAGLVGMAFSIAQSSGGFFGFGNKIDKKEEVAIALVAQALGITG